MSVTLLMMDVKMRVGGMEQVFSKRDKRKTRKGRGGGLGRTLRHDMNNKGLTKDMTTDRNNWLA